MKVKSLSCVQLFVTPWTAGSSVQGIFQARVLEWGAIEGIGYPLQYSWASLVAQLVKNLPTLWETWV